MPTYNEVESAPISINSVLALLPSVHILVVDDGSKDGTVRAIKDACSGEFSTRLFSLERPGKQGLGSAYLTGFEWGLERGYELLIEMDADGSHQSRDLAKLLDVFAANQTVDLVLGSRWVIGGCVIDWPIHREFLSRSANLYARWVLGCKVKDMTSGFRVYKASALKKIDFAGVQSDGYCFQIEMTQKIISCNGVVLEVPITFIERKFGSSKMNWKIVLEAMFRVTLWGIKRKK
jgi:dolichol-phosphate mannosyltransferase